MNKILIMMLILGLSTSARAQVTEPAPTDEPQMIEAKDVVEDAEPNAAIPEAVAENAPEGAEEQPAENAEPEATEEEPAPQVPDFAPEFLFKLHKCEPAVSEPLGEGDDDSEKLEIIGIKGDKCQMKYAFYDLSVPLMTVPNIRNIADMQVMLRSPETARFNYVPQYVYDGLLFALDACRNKKDYAGRHQLGQTGPAKWDSGLTAEYFGKVCTIYLNNQVEIFDDLVDWTVTCRVEEDDVKEILSYYQEVLDEYGKTKHAVVDGRLQTTEAEENEVTKQADKELMYYLQQNNYCQKPQ